MRKKTIYTRLLVAIRTAVSESAEKPFTDELVKSLKKPVAPLAKFFDVHTDEAIVLSFIFEQSLRNEDTNREELMQQFGKDITAMADLENIVQKLGEKRLIILRGVNRRFRNHFKALAAAPKALMAMSEGNADFLEIRKLEDFPAVIMEVNDLIIQRIAENISTETLTQDVQKLLEINNHLPEVQWVLSRKDLSDIHRLIFLNVCVEHLNGEEDVELEKMIREVTDSHHLRLQCKQELRDEKSPLFANNYILYTEPMFGPASSVQLSESVLEKLFNQTRENKQKLFQPRTGTFLPCESIPEEKLFYNAKEKKQIDSLARVLLQDQYAAITQKMKAQHLKPGFTVLMYGQPGTGKTSTVKTLARKTGRHVFLVDIPKIVSKWVGDSEKNISRIFEEYRKASEKFDKAPILLFNEADAILGTRTRVDTSVDKMRNTMQNILLQEMEDFEGILVATTNLVGQLDEAFDRRFLYKLEFHKPEESVQLQILQEVFPHIGPKTLARISREFSLTGGQISNIRKKLLVGELLEEIEDLDAAIFERCEEECSLRKGNKTGGIGFKYGQEKRA
jgi:ATP-dependent Clp protease ATP-binding subunit ClpA